MDVDIKWLHEAVQEVNDIAPEAPIPPPKSAAKTTVASRRCPAIRLWKSVEGYVVPIVLVISCALPFVILGIATLPRVRTFTIVDKGVFEVTHTLAYGREKVVKEYDIFGPRGWKGVPMCVVTPAVYSATTIGQKITCNAQWR